MSTTVDKLDLILGAVREKIEALTAQIEVVTRERDELAAIAHELAGELQYDVNGSGNVENVVRRRHTPHAKPWVTQEGTWTLLHDYYTKSGWKRTHHVEQLAKRIGVPPEGVESLATLLNRWVREDRMFYTTSPRSRIYGIRQDLEDPKFRDYATAQLHSASHKDNDS